MSAILRALAPSTPRAAPAGSPRLRASRIASSRPRRLIVRGPARSLAPRAKADAESSESTLADADAAAAEFDPPWSAPGYRGAAVSAMAPPAQAAAVATVWGGIGLATWFACGVVGPAVADAFPGYMAWSRGTWPVLGLTYVLAGVAHFALPKGFEDMYPHEGAWGFWRLPGSPAFHVAWTGVAEILGGLGVASQLAPASLGVPEWIPPTSALALFALTVAVTPANTYMWTHNAPGPLPEDPDESMLSMAPSAHLARATLQVLLLSVMWGVAHPPP